MLYAYAAVVEGMAYGNFTPSVAGDVPAIVELAEKHGAPLAGKDGKTGQTMIKTAIAPALRTRALHVDGWFSTNILGNRDGLALNNPNSLRSKVTTKASVLDSLLGYEVEDHIVDIRYYRPRGDDKEAWDNIDVTGLSRPKDAAQDQLLVQGQHLGSAAGHRDRARPRARQAARRRRRARPARGLLQAAANARRRARARAPPPRAAALAVAGSGRAPDAMTNELSSAMGLLRALADLKRMRVAHRSGSLAQHLFEDAVAALTAGASPARVALTLTARALTLTSLGGVDADVLARAPARPHGRRARAAPRLRRRLCSRTSRAPANAARARGGRPASVGRAGFRRAARAAAESGSHEAGQSALVARSDREPRGALRARRGVRRALGASVRSPGRRSVPHRARAPPPQRRAAGRRIFGRGAARRRARGSRRGVPRSRARAVATCRGEPFRRRTRGVTRRPIRRRRAPSTPPT